MTGQQFIANHISRIGSSGIRRVFDLGTTLQDPINLSIGQPDYDVNDDIKDAMIRAVRAGHNAYTLTRGLPELRERIASALADEFGREPDVFITSGVSGGLFLALLACLNPLDEVLVGDPYFVSYPYLTRLAGGRTVPVSLYDDFALHPDRFADAITDRTKIILICSPGNPTGVVYPPDALAELADVARARDLLIISDEIYATLTYDAAHASVYRWAPERTIVLRGFGKTYGMTGWRMGFAAGPDAVIAEMAKLQQYTYVCAPRPAQHACIDALATDVSPHVNAYRAKRDLVCAALSGVVDFVTPRGGFYVFPKAPACFPNATAFVEAAIARNLLLIPGDAFSSQDTHFRISYAAPDDKIRKGCDIIRALAKP